MTRFRRKIRLLMLLAACAATWLAPSAARAQDASSGGAENINGATANPDRFLYESGVCQGCAATNVTNNPRAENLNPEGINFSDCEQNLRMDFSLTISGFAASDEATIQIWAGTIDCTQPINRVPEGGAAHPCWQVATPIGPLTAATTSLQKSVYARDVLRYEQPPADPTVSQGYSSSYNYSKAGELACHVQPDDAAVPLGIFFIAVDPTGTKTLGTAYEYSLTADLVAPPPPTVSNPLPGDTLLTVNWTSPGDDPDIMGFAVYSDPPSGTASNSGGCGCGPAPGGAAASYVPEEASTSSEGGSTLQCVDAGADAAPKCTMINQGGTGNTSSCTSNNLTGYNNVVNGTPVDAGGATSVDASDDAGDGGTDEAGTTITLTGGGTSNINPTYLAGEVDSSGATSLQLVGLTNGVKYKVGVASLDSSGNVGPLSPLQCGTAGAVNDFLADLQGRRRRFRLRARGRGDQPADRLGVRPRHVRERGSVLAAPAPAPAALKRQAWPERITARRPGAGPAKRA